MVCVEVRILAGCVGGARGGASEPPADLHDVAGARLMMLAGLLWIIMTQEEDTGFLLPPNCHVSGGGEWSALDPALSTMVIFI